MQVERQLDLTSMARRAVYDGIGSFETIDILQKISVDGLNHFSHFAGDLLFGLVLLLPPAYHVAVTASDAK
jgi:hypothetical protein